MTTLLEPGITYTEVPIQWDTWEDMAYESDERKMGITAEQVKGIGEPWYAPAGSFRDCLNKWMDEVIKADHTEIMKLLMYPTGMEEAFDTSSVEALAYMYGPLTVDVVFTPVKPVEQVTIPFDVLMNLENLTKQEEQDAIDRILNSQDPCAKVVPYSDEEVQEIVDGFDHNQFNIVCDQTPPPVIGLMTKKEREQQSDLEYFQNKVANAVGTDRLKAEEQLEVAKAVAYDPLALTEDYFFASKARSDERRMFHIDVGNVRSDFAETVVQRMHERAAIYKFKNKT